MVSPGALAFDAVRVQRIDADLKHDLIASLEHIDVTGGLTHLHERSVQISERLRARAVPPGVYGAYYGLVYALLAEESANVERQLELLLKEVFGAERERVIGLGDAASDPFAEMITRMVDTDPDRRFLLESPSPEECATFANALDVALAFLREHWRAAYDELSILARLLVLAKPAIGSDDDFDGASTYMCWGAVVLNAAPGKTRIGLLETVIHESSHNLLFGLSMDEALVEDCEDRFPSPLRADPRPLDGIFHATFVSARMAAFLKGLARRVQISATETEELEQRIRVDLSNTRDGLKVLKQSALTDLGNSIMNDIDAFANAPASLSG